MIPKRNWRKRCLCQHHWSKKRSCCFAILQNIPASMCWREGHWTVWRSIEAERVEWIGRALQHQHPYFPPRHVSQCPGGDGWSTSSCTLRLRCAWKVGNLKWDLSRVLIRVRHFLKPFESYFGTTQYSVKASFCVKFFVESHPSNIQLIFPISCCQEQQMPRVAGFLPPPHLPYVTVCWTEV